MGQAKVKAIKGKGAFDPSEYAKRELIRHTSDLS